MSTYPTDGARVFAETGKTKAQLVLEEANIPAEYLSEVGLLMNATMNSGPGWIPSTAAGRAVSIYNREGIDGVRSRLASFWR